MDNDVSSITLHDEEGIETEFEVITKLDIEGKEYIIVSPDKENEDTAIAMRIDKNENGEEVFVTVEDEDEFEIVSEAYETLFSEYDLN